MSTGKRAGQRRGTRARPKPRLSTALYAAGTTLAVAGWGYLVWMAIDFGRSARDGDAAHWAFLAVSALGAMACLFTAVMLVARLLRSLGITSLPVPTPRVDSTVDPATDATGDPYGPTAASATPPGGRRRA